MAKDSGRERARIRQRAASIRCNLTQNMSKRGGYMRCLMVLALLSVLLIASSQAASLQGKAWHDLNYDGLQDPGEPGLTDVNVELQDENGNSLNPLQATSSDGSGNYNFSPLPGRYKVKFTLPSGKAFSPKDQGADDSKDSDADPTSGKTDVITITAGQSYSYWDVGMYENMIVINEIYPNPIGNDNQEGEVSWERVELKNIGSVACNIGQWTINDDDTPPILATIPSGTILLPGGYLVVHVGGPSRGISNSDGDPVILCNYAGLEMDRVFCPISRSKEGLSYSSLPDASDNWNFWGEPTLGGDLAQSSLPGALNLGQDLGDAPSSASTARSKNGPRHFVTGLHLGFLIDYEQDGRPTVGANGDDNAGQDDEDGVTFTYIIIGLQSKFNVTASAPGILQAWVDFNADGLFDDPAECIASNRALSAGEQTITFDVPSEAKAGYTYARFRFSSASGLSPCGLALDGEVEDYRVQVSSQYFLGDRVWEDLNGDGLQDESEPGVDGVVVNLRDGQDNIVARQTTSSEGYYKFPNPLPGSYYQEFLQPNGYYFTSKDAGTDDEKDSDADPVTHLAGPVTVVLGQSNPALDAGLYRPASISGKTFHDKDASGIMDPDESGLKGWRIYLDLDDDNQWDDGSEPGTTAEASEITDSSGNYEFSNLAPGSYRVRQVPQEGWMQSCPAASVYVETLSSGQLAEGRNFGNMVVSGRSVSGKKSTEIGNQVAMATGNGRATNNIKIVSD